jgi:hypothetical protein
MPYSELSNCIKERFADCPRFLGGIAEAAVRTQIAKMKDKIKILAKVS